MEREEMLSAFTNLVSEIPVGSGEEALEEEMEEIERYISERYGEEIVCNLFLFEDLTDYLNHNHSLYSSIAPILCLHLHRQEDIIVAYLLE